MAKKVLEPFIYPIDPQVHLVCGADEAGRGPLVGNVVAACVILDPSRPISGLADSKKLSEKKRDALALQIKENALAYGIGQCTPKEIDRMNILYASLEAMRRAYVNMHKTCELMLIDDFSNLEKLIAKADVVYKNQKEALASFFDNFRSCD